LGGIRLKTQGLVLEGRGKGEEGSRERKNSSRRQFKGEDKEKRKRQKNEVLKKRATKDKKATIYELASCRKKNERGVKKKHNTKNHQRLSKKEK